MTPPYKSFKELAKKEVEDNDYHITLISRESPVLIMAPHGGKIEPGTTQIAQAVAGDAYSFYSFEGLKPTEQDNQILHIESHLFNEPHALKAVRKTEIVITIHGQGDNKDEFVMIGGLNTRLALEIQKQFKAAGFQTLPPTEKLSAVDQNNICNRGITGGGVQLEISRKLRDSLMLDKGRLQEFAGAVCQGISSYMDCCADIFSGFVFHDLRTAKPLDTKGVYAIRVKQKGEDPRKIILLVTQLIKTLNWDTVGKHILSRINRLEHVGKCSTLYIGSAGTRKDSKKTLKSRYEDFSGRHTAMYPIWALVYFGWELQFGWKQEDDPASAEAQLKTRYKELHNNKLPALVSR